jgi:hypothetical protein
MQLKSGAVAYELLPSEMPHINLQHLNTILRRLIVQATYNQVCYRNIHKPQNLKQTLPVPGIRFNSFAF